MASHHSRIVAGSVLVPASCHLPLLCSIRHSCSAVCRAQTLQFDTSNSPVLAVQNPYCNHSYCTEHWHIPPSHNPHYCCCDAGTSPGEGSSCMSGGGKGLTKARQGSSKQRESTGQTEEGEVQLQPPPLPPPAPKYTLQVTMSLDRMQFSNQHLPVWMW